MALRLITDAPTDGDVEDALDDQESSAPSDQELIIRCQQRDGVAWELLVGRYERLVYAVALRNGLSPEDAADVTQTTFVALLGSLEGLRDTTRLASWLMTVSRRNAWRVRDRASTVSLVAEVPEGASADAIAEWDALADLYDGLNALDSKCRELLTSLYLDPEEPSYAEIASRLGRAAGGIGPLRGRCLQRLRSIMEGDVRSA